MSTDEFRKEVTFGLDNLVEDSMTVRAARVFADGWGRIESENLGR